MATHNSIPTSPSRRAAIAAGLGGAFTLVGATGADAPALTAADQRVLQLWRRRRRVKAIYERYYAAWRAADDQLPPWADSGFKYALRDGSPASEEKVGWPMVADPSRRPVERGGIINVRPNPTDLFTEWSKNEDRQNAIHEYAEALMELSQRLKERVREENRLGIDRLSAGIEDASGVRYAIEDRIRALVDVSALAAAAMLIVEIECDDTEPQLVELHPALLRAIRPRLVGEIAEDADRVLRQEPATAA